MRKLHLKGKSKFNKFHEIFDICSLLESCPDNRGKTDVISTLLGSDNFDGDLLLWLRFLIRESDPRKYNLADKKLINLLSKILKINESKGRNHE
ncbi:DNA ligase ATP-dependent N-terminal domain-containing protein [Caenorhabditis elegans]|uniref:DNA ligase ATP-dependent N-terminal domain-containing protein n=1 Tax=Caenorhabditis elegans TaxID=6239 RepID=Q9GUG2_CAEEL|nr:DNA ligase ATP-dependent N-terminal domain-containing protein [Caenorhabditis elegans]CCD74164.2 DNA ligase ATP-dependent N-terminal domain-containing protein [Caenorhabditis elegans]|eukprot:NP_500970.2 Uncharacterized protein CELE_Y73B6BL.14 [Caenorhabditis elegans]